MRSDTGPASAGFTLLEVVVALAVVTLGIIAAFNLVVQISTGSLQMKERTIAGWIASNEITRLRLSGEFPEVSQFDGDTEFAGELYRWRATVSETGVDELRRIDMDVSYADDPDLVIGRSTGFISPLPPPRLGGSNWTAAAVTGPGTAEDVQNEGGEPDDGDPQQQTPETDGNQAEGTQ